MSSGERAKPPATFEERNPFDISRRSGTEVAAEIAKRMAAWKTARSRTSGAPRTAPRDESKQEPKQPSIAAPVQPARLPKRTGAAEQWRPAEERPADSAPARGKASPPRREGWAPFFATFSIQRAMPPAPSLKQPEPQPQSAIEPAPESAEPARETAVSQSEPSIETPESVPPPVDAAAADPVAMADTSLEIGKESLPAEEAMAASAEAQPSAMTASETEPSKQDLSGGEQEEQPSVQEASEERPIAPKAPLPVSDDTENLRARARAIRERWMAAHDVEVDAGNGQAATAAPMATEPEPPHATAAPVPSDFPSVEELDAAVTGQAPSEQKPRPDLAEEAGEEEAPSDAPHAREFTLAVPTVDELDDLSGRKEPTFDAPASAKRVRRKRAIESKPALAAAAAVSATTSSKPRIIEMPRMQTRIEARRVNSLRADPQLSAHHADWSPVEAETWDVPTPIATSAAPRHGGTGWAIGLGALLLVLGITAPAAIWQQGRHASQDQAFIDPMPLAPEQQAAIDTQPLQTDVQLPPGPPLASSAKQSAARPEVDQDKPIQQASLGTVRDGGDVADAPVSAPPPPWKNAQVPVAKPADQAPKEVTEKASAAKAAKPAKVAPPAAKPMQVLEAPPTPKSTHVLEVPTTGSASVAVNGGSTGTQSASVTLKPTLMGQLKPDGTKASSNAAIGSGAAQKAIPDPEPQAAPQPRQPVPAPQPGLDQMFQTLIDTIAKGKPSTADPSDDASRGTRQ